MYVTDWWFACCMLSGCMGCLLVFVSACFAVCVFACGLLHCLFYCWLILLFVECVCVCACFAGVRVC